MAKPICVIKVDNKPGTFTPIYQIQSLLDDRLNDYHVLVVPFEQPADEYHEPMQVQVFHEKDFTEIQYAELKKIISDAVETVAPNGS